MVFRARCCNPIRGEKIVGYITRGKGVSVHSATCPNVVNLLYDPERRIDVEWDKGDGRRALHRAADDAGRGSEGHPRRRQLEDRRHQHQHHATSKRRSTTISTGRIDMTVEISDVKHLEKVIKSLRSVDGVLDVERASALEPGRRVGCGLTDCKSDRAAMALQRCDDSISTRASFGSRAAWTVARAGAGDAKYVA